PEASLRELHDISFVHQREARFLMFQSELNCRSYQAFCTLLRYGFDTDARRFGEPDFLKPFRESLFKECQERLVLVRARLEFDSRIDVLRVLAEKSHICLMRFLHRRG